MTAKQKQLTTNSMSSVCILKHATPTHRHQSIVSSIPRVIPRVTSDRASSPTSQYRHFLNPSNAYGSLYKLCPTRPCDYLTTVRSSALISQRPVSRLFTQIPRQTLSTAWSVLTRATFRKLAPLPSSGHWLSLHAHSYYFSNITTDCYEEPLSWCSNHYTRQSVRFKRALPKNKGSCTYKVSLAKPSVCPTNCYSCHKGS
jgi:hypothetical protein